MYTTESKANRSRYRMLSMGLMLLFFSIKSAITYQTYSKTQQLRPTFGGSFSGKTMLPAERHLLVMNPTIPPTNDLNCTPLSIENFPRDQFTQKQRRSGAVMLHVIAAAYTFFALALVCDEYFIPCLEVICDVLHLQPDVAGATFMAAGSSAPELATTLVGVFIARDDIGLGAVVGSADYNVMFVISVCALFSKEVIYLNWWPLVRDCTFYLISIILLAAIIADEKVYWYEALVLLIFYVLYIVLMKFNRQMDTFLNAWCLAHRSICPRVIHDDVTDAHLAAQSSGKFGGKQLVSERGETLGLNAADAPVTNYSRLQYDDEETMHNLNMTEISDGMIPDGLPVSDPETTVAPSKAPADGVTAEIGEDPRTLIQICLAPLAFPPRGTSALKWIFYLLAWPIRLCLCLTTPDCRSPKWRRLRGHWISFVVCCFWIGVFTILMIWMITIIGVTFGIPDTIMGLTLIAAGSSVPDAITSVIVVREGEGDMAVSNAVGSNIFDILVCMGLPWLMRCVAISGPVEIYSRGLTYATLTLFATVLILLAATHLNRWRLTKPYGVGLMVAYLLFLVICSLYELNIFGMVHPPECLYIETP